MLHKHERRLERQSSALTNFHEQFTFVLIASKQGSANYSPYVSLNTSGAVFPNITHIVNTRSSNYQACEVYSQAQGSNAGFATHMFLQTTEGILNLGNNGQLGTNFNGANFSKPLYPVGLPQVYYIGPLQVFYNNMVRGRCKERDYFKPKLIC